MKRRINQFKSYIYMYHTLIHQQPANYDPLSFFLSLAASIFPSARYLFFIFALRTASSIASFFAFALAFSTLRLALPSFFLATFSLRIEFTA